MRTRQQTLDYLKEYREANKERISQQKRDWYQEHKAEQRQKRREYYLLNKDSYIERAAEWSKQNPDKMKTARKNWRLNNMQAMNMHGSNYRAKKRGLIREKYNRLIVYERDGGICGICREMVHKYYKHPHPESLTIDHIIPISKGGHDILGNIQIAHFGCNSRKRDRI